MQSEEEGQFTTLQPPHIENDRASIVEKLLEYQKLLLNIRNFLLGYYEIQEGGQTKTKQDNEFRLLNDQGCRAILFEISQRISPQSILGCISESEAKDRARRFEIALSEKLINNFSDWDVKNISAADIIIDSLGDMIFISLTRPIDSRAFNGIIDISQLREQMIQRDIQTKEEPKESLFRKTIGKLKGG